MILLDGKATSQTIRTELAGEVRALAEKHGRPPGLAVVIVGEDPASKVYVRMKVKACHETGILSRHLELPESTSQAELERVVDDLNADPSIDGILVQLPLPRQLDAQPILDRINPDKDVDGFHPVNVGRLALGLPGFVSCTPAGCMELLRRYGLRPEGKHAVIVGRSNIVGKPLALLLQQPTEMGNATVTVCHSRTPDLAEHTRRADFLFAAIGKPGMISGDMVKDGAVVVDVGISRTDDGLKGDCDFEAMRDRVSAITPVPGGVGPMTIAMLLRNTVDSCARRLG
ncbi:bifunctional methylenetetrahydrofolate dehydrogenase/methenyltetrahydrofolate cyclohydrolase FolD [Desulfohalovibrio reitneri]|uniref:bifunctional methylenetetrahydrofolate dehydrogenase/methenyltetrahydrofolate cyclohydrolase FolD n=1 Tax=Desulfohalovibrio reitneri TaxID=1307759 RepID=UPI0004A70757|nr:bifunctional methylenetetrahydrofolate dehydrogenase/methenyltetrahydrofolate cyclohydrolase FolD [Desulfohalovibrio reitneri]